jgi:hypothetical protein
MTEGMASFSMKMNPDLWIGVEKAENPEAALKERILHELDMQGYDKFEVEAIGSDPTFNESLRNEYRSAYRQFHGWRHSYPGSIRLHYQKLGTRKKSGKPEKGEG